jgi:hypothetical protein
MARDVVFADVRRRVGEFGELATLVTVTDAGTPHAVTVLVEATDDRLAARVGPRTLLNLLARPTLSLLWLPTDGGKYQLILDGVAENVPREETVAPTRISIEVTKGILHRLAGCEDTGPTCIPLGA